MPRWMDVPVTCDILDVGEPVQREGSRENPFRMGMSERIARLPLWPRHKTNI